MHRCHLPNCKRPGISFPVLTLSHMKGEPLAHMELRDITFCAFHRDYFFDQRAFLLKLWNRVTQQMRTCGFPRPALALTELTWKSHMNRWKPCP